MSIVYNLSETAREGLALLKSGRAQALKHGRSGKPHLTAFMLSDDETLLSWQPVKIKANLARTIGRRVSATSEPKRSISTSEIVELCIGRESAIFQRRANDSGHEHLSLTLRLMASLPAPPIAHDAPPLAASPSGERQTLDVSFENEEQFGLWVAGLARWCSTPTNAGEVASESAVASEAAAAARDFDALAGAPFPFVTFE